MLLCTVEMFIIVTNTSVISFSHNAVLFVQPDPPLTSPVAPSTEVGVHHGVNAQIPSLLSMPTRNHMDITTPPLPLVAPEVLRVAEHRHKKGLMHPYVYHILTKVCFQAVTLLSLKYIK